MRSPGADSSPIDAITRFALTNPRVLAPLPATGAGRDLERTTGSPVIHPRDARIRTLRCRIDDPALHRVILPSPDRGYEPQH